MHFTDDVYDALKVSGRPTIETEAASFRSKV